MTHIAVVCALPVEFAAAATIFAAQPTESPAGADPNSYSVATLRARTGGTHELVLVLMPEMSNNYAAAVTAHLMRSYSDIGFVIMCGIAAGIPTPRNAETHVRLGDVVTVSEGGVIQYDKGRQVGQHFEQRGNSAKPSARLLGISKRLEAMHMTGDFPWEQYLHLGERIPNGSRPSARTDRLLTGRHPRGDARRPSVPRIHSGAIGSANLLMRNATMRDDLAKRFSIKAIEMEASGLADAAWLSDVPYFIVRGVCDYADSLKNDRWHAYAAVAAASYVRALIEELPGSIEGAQAPVGGDEPSGAEDELLSAHEHREVEQIAYHAPHFVGRRELLSAIRASVSDVTGSEYLIVEAPAGLGKSAVASMALKHARAEEGSWPTVIPFFVNKPSHNSAFDFLLAVLPALSELTNVRFSKSASLDVLTQEFRQQWQLVIKSQPPNGLILLLDGLDEQRVETCQISDLLPTLSGTRTRVLITTRPNPAYLESLPLTHPVHRASHASLEPLTPEEVSTLLQYEVPGTTWKSMARDLHDLTGGNPLFVKLLAGEIRDHGPAILPRLKREGTNRLDKYLEREVLRNIVVSTDAPSAHRLLGLFAVSPAPLSRRDIGYILNLDLATVALGIGPFERLLIGSDYLALYHPEVARVLRSVLGAAALTEAENALSLWIDSYQHRDWPDDTPRFIGENLGNMWFSAKDTRLPTLISPSWSRLHHVLYGSLARFVEDVRMALELSIESENLRETLRLSLLYMASHQDTVDLPSEAVAALLILNGSGAIPEGDPNAREAAVNGAELAAAYRDAAEQSFKHADYAKARPLAIAALSRAEEVDSDSVDYLGEVLLTAARIYVDSGGYLDDSIFSRLNAGSDEIDSQALGLLAASAVRSGQFESFERLRLGSSVDEDLFEHVVAAASVAASFRGQPELASELLSETSGQTSVISYYLMAIGLEEIRCNRGGGVLEVLRARQSVVAGDIWLENLLESLVRSLSGSGRGELALGLIAEQRTAGLRARLTAAAVACGAPGRDVRVRPPKADDALADRWWLDFAVAKARLGQFQAAHRAISRVVRRLDIRRWTHFHFQAVAEVSQLENRGSEGLSELGRDLLASLPTQLFQLDVDNVLAAFASLAAVLVEVGDLDGANKLIGEALESLVDHDEDLSRLNTARLALELAKFGLAIEAQMAMAVCVRLHQSRIDSEEYFGWVLSVLPVAVSAMEPGELAEMSSRWSGQFATYHGALAVASSAFRGMELVGREDPRMLSPFGPQFASYDLVRTSAGGCRECVGHLTDSAQGFADHKITWSADGEEFFGLTPDDAVALGATARELVRSREYCAARSILVGLSAYERDLPLVEALPHVWWEVTGDAPSWLLSQISDADRRVDALFLTAWKVPPRRRKELGAVRMLLEAEIPRIRPRYREARALIQGAVVASLAGDTSIALDLYSRCLLCLELDTLVVMSADLVGLYLGLCGADLSAAEAAIAKHRLLAGGLRRSLRDFYKIGVARSGGRPVKDWSMKSASALESQLLESVRLVPRRKEPEELIAIMHQIVIGPSRPERWYGASNTICGNSILSVPADVGHVCLLADEERAAIQALSRIG